MSLSSQALPALSGASATQIADEMHPVNAETLATHACGWRNGMPAITLNRKGKGLVVYVGVLLEQPGIKTLTNWLCDTSGIERDFARPNGVSIYERSSDSYRLLFLINWTPEPQSVEIGNNWQDAFTKEPLAAVIIPPNEIRIAMTTTRV